MTLQPEPRYDGEGTGRTRGGGEKKDLRVITGREREDSGFCVDEAYESGVNQECFYIGLLRVLVGG